MIYYANQNGYSIRLLQTSDYKRYALSKIRSDEGEIKAIVNFPFFNSSYIIGRYQGDVFNDTVDQANFKGNNIVIFKNNTYKIAKMNSWDNQDIDNIAGGFCPSAVLLKGKSLEVSETIIEQGQYSATSKINRTAICYDTEYHFIVGESVTVDTFLSEIKKTYPNYEFIALGDSGGSSELIIDGQIQNSLADGSERPNYCGLAFIKPTSKKLFCPRYSKDGMKNNKYWYDKTWNAGFNDGASGDSALPNCVTYASGRFSEENGQNLRNIMKDYKGFSNANRWYSDTSMDKGSTPKLGAIACFGGTLGHVAIVEAINDDGTITVSQSNYQAKKDYNSSNYFQVKTYKKFEVGKVASGVGLMFQGYIYPPNLRYAVTRDKTKDQVEVLADRLKVRKSANGDWQEGIFAHLGIFDIQEVKTAGDYTWAKLDDECWIALNDKDEWTKTYLKESDDTDHGPNEDDYKTKYEELLVKYNTLNANYVALENDYKSELVQADNLTTQNKSLTTSLEMANKDIEKLSEQIKKIKEIINE